MDYQHRLHLQVKRMHALYQSCINCLSIGFIITDKNEKERILTASYKLYRNRTALALATKNGSIGFNYIVLYCV